MILVASATSESGNPADINAYSGIWSSQLSGLSAEPASVLEIACGSGNDYTATSGSFIARKVGSR